MKSACRNHRLSAKPPPLHRCRKLRRGTHSVVEDLTFPLRRAARICCPAHGKASESKTLRPVRTVLALRHIGELGGRLTQRYVFRSANVADITR